MFMFGSYTRKILSLIRFDNIKVSFITISQTMAVLFFYNPLLNEDLDSWNRTFCGAVLAGISIGKRVRNFYFLIIFLFPIAFIFFTILNNALLKEKITVNRIFRINLPLFVCTLMLYIVRYKGIIQIHIMQVIEGCIILFYLGIEILAYNGKVLYGKNKLNCKKRVRIKINIRNVFINFYWILLMFYFFTPISAPGTQKYATLKEYIIFGILRNHVFVIEVMVSVFICIIGWLVLYLLDYKYLNCNLSISKAYSWLGWISILPIISAYVYKFIAKPFTELGATFEFLTYNSKIDDISAQMLLIAGFILSTTIGYYINKEKDPFIHQPFYIVFTYICCSVFLNIFVHKYEISILLITAMYIAVEVYLKIKGSFILNPILVAGFFWLPTVYVFIVSLLFLLNENGIYVKNYILVIAISMISFEILFLYLGKRNDNLLTCSYVGGVTSLSCIHLFHGNYQLTFDFQNYANVYELANGTVAIDTLNYGKIPIVDYFSAHALSDVIGRLIFSGIHSNNGKLGGVFVGSSLILGVIGILALFYILSQVMPIEFVAVAILSFPLNVKGLKSFSVSLIVVAAFCYMYKRGSIKSKVLFWLIALVTAFYKYDDGIALGMACIIAYLLAMIVKKDKKQILNFILLGMITGVIALVSYVIYCYANHIDILFRTKEWFSVTFGSNSTWATEYIANYSLIPFFVAYFVAPCSCVGLLIVVLCSMFREKDVQLLKVLIIVFAITEVIFIPRTIIFHNWSIGRGMTGVLMNYWPWTISLFILFISKNKKLHGDKCLFDWTAAFIGCVLIECSFVFFIVPSNSSTIVSSAANNSDEYKITCDMSSIFGEEKVLETDETSEFYGQFKDIFSLLLKEDETFLDFANITSLYAYTNRARPFYVGQSPSLLTDLYSQQCYLDEIRHYIIPLVITGNTNDGYIRMMTGIPHNIRYYKIAEYIYSKYRPFIKMNDFTIWCDRERYLEYLDLLKNDSALPQYSLVDYGFDTGLESHIYNIGKVPYLWANVDEYGAVDGLILCSLVKDGAGEYEFEGSKYVNSEQGNYLLLECVNESDHECNMNVILRDNDNSVIYQYSMCVKPGNNKYIIRVSQDYFWTSFNINHISFEIDGDCNVNAAKILKGD